MRLPLPLYARALLLLAANLLLLAVLFFAGGGWGSLLSDSARERVAGIGERVCAELSARAESAWPEVLAGYSRRYGVDFSTTGPKGPFGGRGGPPGGPPPPPGAVPGGVPDWAPGPPPDAPPGPPPGPMPGNGPGGGPNLGGHNDRLELSRSSWWGPYRLFVPGQLQTDRGSRPLDVIITAPSLAAMARFLGIGEWARLALLAAGISVLLWLPFLAGVARAVARMRDATQQIAEGRFQVRVPAGRGDELGQLAGSVNHMAERLERYVAGQKQFLADVAHETISPLARIQVGLGLLEARLGAEDAETLRDVQDDVRQMSELLNELLLFSRAGVQAQRAARERVDLRAVVDEARDRENLAAEIPGLAPCGAALAHRALLLRALGNLLRNAHRHGGGAVEIAGARNGARVQLWVRDRGPGVPVAALAQLGEPFFRPDVSRSRDSGGYGLGLAIVRRCVEACEGELLLRNREGGGFEAEIRLDAAELPTAATPGG